MSQSGRAATKKELTTDYSDDTDKKSESASLKIFAEMKDFFLRVRLGREARGF